MNHWMKVGILTLLLATAGMTQTLTLVSETAMPNYTRSLELDGDMAWIGAEDGLHRFDISDLANPVEVEFYNQTGYVVDVERVGDYLLLNIPQQGMQVWEILPDLSIAYTGNQVDMYYCRRSTVAGDVVYVAREGTGISSIDISNLPQITMLDSVNPVNFVYRVVVDGNYLYASDGWAGLSIWDVSDPGNITLIANEGSANSHGICKLGDYVYIGDNWNGLRTWDVSDPYTPTYDGLTPIAQEGILEVIASHNTIFSAGYDHTLYAFDVSTQPPPYPILDSMPISNSTNTEDMDVRGPYVFVVGVGGFFSIYHADWIKLDVVLAAEHNLTVPQGGSFTYDATVSCFLNQASSIDIWTEAILPNGNTYGPVWVVQDIPVGPSTVLSAADLYQAIPMATPGDYQFVMHSGQYPMHIGDTDSFPFTIAPVMISGGSTEWKADGVETAFRADDLASMAPATPDAFVLVPAHPNPFNPSTQITVQLPSDGNLSVVVYDVMGREIAQLAEGNHAAGSHAFVFDGHSLASGVYLVRASHNGHHAMQKVMLVK